MSSWLARCCITAVLCLVGNSPLSAEETADVSEQSVASRRPPPTIYMGRRIAPTMHYSGADWLTRTTREQEEKPQEFH